MMLTFARRFGAVAVPTQGRLHIALANRIAKLLAHGRRPARLCALWAFLPAMALTACSETSLNEAPIVDLSMQSRAAAVKPPPMAIPAAPGETIYTVKKGDTLFHLASNAGATMQDLARWNGIDEHAPIFVGQQLRLQSPGASSEAADNGVGTPAAGMDADAGTSADAVATPIPLRGGNGVETRALDAPPGTAAPLPAAATAISAMPSAVSPLSSPLSSPPASPPSPAPVPGAAATAPAPTLLPAAPVAPAPAIPVPAPAPAQNATTAGTATAGWIWPAAGTVTANFDATRKGIEIAAAEDAPVVAVADGMVSYVGSPRDYGNLIILKHGDELLSVYAHNKTLLVKEGQAVRRGQTIGTAGKSPGIAATLHFEVRRNHVPIDPLGVLPLR
jgi:lipoprotein NlpD